MHSLEESQPANSPMASMHRCLLISDIFCLILEFTHQSDEEDQRKRTLAMLARTCRAFSGPALDLLWMRLDSLEPLIRIFPSDVWKQNHPRFVVWILTGDKHWSTFRKYAARVLFLRGPSHKFPAWTQRDFFAAVARFPGASLPLLPNIIELVWGDPKPVPTTFARGRQSDITETMALLKYVAGPNVTTLSLFSECFPSFAARAVLADLPTLCPNVTSFTASHHYISNNDHQEIGDIVRRWSNIQVLRSCALPKDVMNKLASQKTLNTLCIELGTIHSPRYLPDVNFNKLPATVHTFSLEGCAIYCTRYLQAVKGNPTYFCLGVQHGIKPEVDSLFRILPTRLDTTRLRNLTVSLDCWRDWYFPCRVPLTEPILASLYAFSALVTLDLTKICALKLDDAAYARMARAWPELRSLKIGVSCVCKPIASMGAVIEVLKSCTYLETLNIAFDGSIPPPPPRSWGVLNRNITEIYIGHSPLGENLDQLGYLASCLGSVMPLLRRIRRRNVRAKPRLAERWGTVERLLVDNESMYLT